MKKLAVAVAIGSCLVGLIIAGIPRLGDAAVIYGCYGKGTWAPLRIVSAPGQCYKSENPISWNDVGVKGDTGPQGLTGLTGLKGDKGDPGAQGPACVTNGITQVIHGTVGKDGEWVAGDNWWSYTQVDEEYDMLYAILLRTMTEPSPRPQCVANVLKPWFWEMVTGLWYPPAGPQSSTDVFWSEGWNAWVLHVYLFAGDSESERFKFDFICVQ